MLCRLTVTNYALIANLDIEFGKSFSVITGETGAGKSIILGALSLILGNRADNHNFFDESKKICVEGTFDISHCDLVDFFTDNNLDYDHSCIIRREITPQGKSRAFINDTPVNLNQLKEVASHLIDVHSQHQTLLLRDNSFQLSVVDTVADNKKLLSKYQSSFKKWQNVSQQLAETRLLNQKSKSELDYLLFVLDEFYKANLKAGEQEQLEEELDVQSHAEEIKTKLYLAANLLNGEDESILRKLKETINAVNTASYYFTDLKNVTDRLESVLIELKDITEFIDESAESIQFDPARMEQINERLTSIYKLQQKHNAKDLNTLLSQFETFESKAKEMRSLDDKVIDLEREYHIVYNELAAYSKELTDSRKQITSFIEENITNTIAQLGIKNGIFKIEWIPLERPSKYGMDDLKFLFSANKGNSPNDILKVASGGELSRLMLAVKSLISLNNLLPTIVFDEIDTGISGDIAVKVGKILRTISAGMQVIAITHLPQIAALSEDHYKVYKESDENKTWTKLRKLKEDEKIDELALMISGSQNSTGARRAAIELLNINSQ